MPPLRQMKCCVSVSAKGTSRQLACKKWPQLSHPSQSNPSFTTRLFSASQIAQHILVYRTQSSLLTRLMYSWYQRINDQMTFQYYPEFRPENVLQRQNVNRILLGTLPDAIDTFSNASIVYYSWKRYMYKQCFWKLFNILFSEVYNNNDCFLQLPMICLYMKHLSCFTADHSIVFRSFFLPPLVASDVVSPLRCRNTSQLFKKRKGSSLDHDKRWFMAYD